MHLLKTDFEEMVSKMVGGWVDGNFLFFIDTEKKQELTTKRKCIKLILVSGEL